MVMTTDIRQQTLLIKIIREKELKNEAKLQLKKESFFLKQLPKIQPFKIDQRSY